MDRLIQDFNNQLSISTRKSEKRQNKIVPKITKPLQQITVLHSPKPIKVLVNNGILNINQIKLYGPEPNVYKINNVLSYVYLDKNEDEFKNVKSLFAKSSLRLKSVRRVYNPYLKKAFELRRNLYYSGKLPLKLFHGTKEKYVDNICTYNFDWRLGGLEKGHKYGKGVNFSTSPYFASFFCDKGRKRVMIVADVLVDNIENGNINTVVPPRGSDTTTGKNGTVLVKFYDNEFYPRYVVNFEIFK